MKMFEYTLICSCSKITTTTIVSESPFLTMTIDLTSVAAEEKRNEEIATGVETKIEEDNNYSYYYRYNYNNIQRQQNQNQNHQYECLAQGHHLTYNDICRYLSRYVMDSDTAIQNGYPTELKKNNQMYLNSMTPTSNYSYDNELLVSIYYKDPRARPSSNNMSMYVFAEQFVPQSMMPTSNPTYDNELAEPICYKDSSEIPSSNNMSKYVFAEEFVPHSMMPTLNLTYDNELAESICYKDPSEIPSSNNMSKYVYAEEFVPHSRVMSNDTLSSDSGQCGSSSSASDSEKEMEQSNVKTKSKKMVYKQQQNRKKKEIPIQQYLKHQPSSELSSPPSSSNNYDEKTCVRCHNKFYINPYGSYYSDSQCNYHYGKYTVNNSKWEYTCCNNQHKKSDGCTETQHHVWNGIVFGMNGPFFGYLKTKPLGHLTSDDINEVYALDTEMCYTAHGLVATKISVVDLHGNPVYESYITPDAKIVDYNTRFSGITENDFIINKSKSLETVQQDLLQLISAETILIGHALNNDLRTLKIVHNKVVDTSIVFMDATICTYKKSLKSLVHMYLGHDIQTSENGHSCLEDSRAVKDLILYKLNDDLDDEMG